MNKNITKIANFFLDKDLIANDLSINKLVEIHKNFKILNKIACFPDLNFKIKNYVPSGTAIQLKGNFAPILLGNPNDSMTVLKIKTNKNLSNKDVKFIFNFLKKKIALFRRKKASIDKNISKDILINGIKNIILKWGFSIDDLKKFQYNGTAKTFKNFKELQKAFPQKRPKGLGGHIKTSNILESSRKCLGVLDGTSHFIELYKYESSINKKFSKNLGFNKNDYYMVIHAGSADPGLIIQQYLINKKEKIFSINTKKGRVAYNLLNSAVNFGFANRLFIAKTIKEVFCKKTSLKAEVEIFIDNNHDFLDFDEISKIFTHRKGAVKINPGSKSIWKKTGEPYFLPSYVGGDGYILSNYKGNKKAFYCSSHGVGRFLNKTETLKKFSKINFNKSLDNKIILFRYGKDKIKSQNPKAFKNINLVLKSFKKYNLAFPILLLKPIASLKA
jgi:ribosomal protein L31E